MAKKKNNNKGIAAINFSVVSFQDAYPAKDNRIIVKGDKEIKFYVSRWLPDTTPEEQKKIFWRWESGNSLPKEGIGRESLLITIPNKHCGSTWYTLSAKLPGQKDKQAAELQILGFCPYKVTSSVWYMLDKKDGKQKTKIEDDQEICFRPWLFLDLEVEGLNGDKLRVDFYARGGSVLVGSVVSPKCVDGKVTLKNLDTLKWKNELVKKCKNWYEREEITIEIAKEGNEYKKSKDKRKDGVYITKDYIQKPLLIVKNISPFIYDKEIANSLSKTKVGESEPINIEFDQCTFDKISIVNEKEEFVLFEKGQDVTPQYLSNRHYIKSTYILFDFDRYTLDRTAIEKLKLIAKYLKESHVSAKLEGHADIKGSVEYNKTLAYQRAKAVEQYLIEGGVESRQLSIEGLNKSELINEGEDIAEELHHENRRVKISFEVMQTYDETLTYAIVSCTEDYPQRFDIKIDGYTNKNCFYEDEYAHKAELLIKPSDEIIPINDGTENIIPFEFCAKQYKMSHSEFIKILEMGSHAEDILDRLKWLVKTYDLHLHSCAYFSDKNKPTVRLSVHPDVVITYNFRFDFDQDYYFGELKSGLIQGNNEWNGLKRTVDETFESLAKLLFLQIDMGSILIDLIYDYIADKINLFQYGIHWFQDFLQKDIPMQAYDEGGKHRRWVEGRIQMYIAGMILVEVALIIFTRGRGLAAKLKTIQKGKKFAQLTAWLGKDIIELITPKVAETSKVGYEQGDYGAVSYVYRYKVKAEPLFGIKYNVKNLDLKDIYKNEEDEDFGEIKKGILNSVLSRLLPYDAAYSLSVNGEISFEYEVKYDYLQKKLVVYDKTTNTEFKDGTHFNMSGLIKIALGIKLEGDNEIKWIPFIPSLGIKGKLEAKVSGGFMLQIRFHTNTINPYYEWVLIFSGFKGEYYQKIEGNINKGQILLDTNENQEDGTPQKPVPFSIMEEKEYVIKRVLL